MTLFVDTSVWSLAFRRDSVPEVPEVKRLREALVGGESVHTTGIVLQELLQGCRGPRAWDRIVDRFKALPLLLPSREDHVEAARLRNECRQHGVQVGTIDALLAQLCISRNLIMLSTDHDFSYIADRAPLQLWHK